MRYKKYLFRIIPLLLMLIVFLISDTPHDQPMWIMLGVAALYVVFYPFENIRETMIKKERERYGYDEFISVSDFNDIDEDFIKSIYDVLQEKTKFPLLATDYLEDVTFDENLLFSKINITPIKLPSKDMHTIADLITFLSSHEKQHSA